MYVFLARLWLDKIYSVLIVVFLKMTGLDERVQTWPPYHLKNGKKLGVFSCEKHFQYLESYHLRERFKCMAREGEFDSPILIHSTAPLIHPNTSMFNFILDLSAFYFSSRSMGFLKSVFSSRMLFFFSKKIFTNTSTYKMDESNKWVPKAFKYSLFDGRK